MRFRLIILGILLLFSGQLVSAQTNYYWRGGSGDWNDLNNWSTAIQGAPAAALPGALDVVHFPLKNPDSPHLTVEIPTSISIGSIHAEQAVHFSGNGNIHVTHLLNLNRSRVEIPVILYAKNQETTLSLTDCFWNSDLIIRAQEEVKLNTRFSGGPSSRLILEKGSFNSNGHTIVLGKLQVMGKSPVKLELGKSHLVINEAIETHQNLTLNWQEAQVHLSPYMSNENLHLHATHPLPNKRDNVCGVLVLTSTNTDINCFGDCDGTAEVTASGGSGAYTYLWNDPAAQSAANATNLCTGTWNVEVNDITLGITCFDFVQINEPPQLNFIAMNITAPQCSYSCDGSANPVIFGGTAPLNFSWSPSGESVANASNLCIGTNTLTVVDDKGCVSSNAVDITTPDPILPNVTVTNIDCFGECTGQVQANPTGGSGVYPVIQWDDPSNSTSLTVSNLCPGTFTINIQDDNGCTGSQVVNVTEPAEGISATEVLQQVSCGGLCDGSINLTTIGGTAPYQYQWSNGETTEDISGLCAGTYDVTITDDNACTRDYSFVITEPTPLTLDMDSTLVTCHSFCDGEGWAIAGGGTPPYQYTWDDPTASTNDSIFDLCPGKYIVEIEDQLGCTITDSLTISEPDTLLANIDGADVTCFGDCDGSASALPTGGTGSYQYAWTPGGATSQTLSNLCAGTYQVTVTDNNNCTSTEDITITQNAELTVSASATNASCESFCDGSAVATANGGDGSYSFVWNDPSTQSGFTATNLCAGSYQVTVTDGQGCIATAGATITDLININIVTSVVSINCQGDCDGQATATASGGTGPYTYLWDDPAAQTTPTATGLCAGDYNVRATDVNGCTSTQLVSILPGPGALVTNGVGTDVSCFGFCDGTVEVAPSGGQGPYDVVWDNGSTDLIRSDLCPGRYPVELTDAAGCVVLDTVDVLEPNTIELNPTLTEPTCNGDCDGSIALAATGGTGALTYDWNTGSTADNIAALCAGNYFVTVEDVEGCQTTQAFVLDQPATLTANRIETNISCFGQCDGIAGVLVGGGTEPYQYFWSPGGQTSSQITDQCAGNYDVLVTDDNGCNRTFSLEIQTPQVIDPNLSVSGVSCSGECDASIVSNPTGGNGPYQFTWNTGAVGNSITDLCAGTYSVTVTDVGGCSRLESVVITEPSVLQASVNKTDESCANTCDGSIAITPVGGTPPYTYQWSPGGETSSNLSNLCPGNYSVTVTDDQGCFVIENMTVIAGSDIQDNVLVTSPACGVCDGELEITPSGGTGPYVVSWSTGSTNTSISSLCAGIYSVTIDDQRGCSETFDYGLGNFNGITGATITASNASCHDSCDASANIIPIGGTPPYTYLWNDPDAQTSATATQLCAGSYLITVTDDNGCIYIPQVTLTEPDTVLLNDLIVDATCVGFCDGSITLNPSGGTGPYTYSWNTGSLSNAIENLCPGTYTVTVQDDNACPSTVDLIVNDANPLVLNVTTTGISCFGVCDGSADVQVTGGVPPYAIVWSDGQTGNTAQNLCAGTYSVTVTDANGCSAVENGILIQNENPLTAGKTFTDASCGTCDGSAQVLPSGGSGTYSYQWNNGVSDPALVGICSGVYTCTITDDNGCSIQEVFSISDQNGPDITLQGTDIACFGDCNGAAEVIINSGNGPMNISWTPDGETSSTISGKCAGTYAVVVEDVAGCRASEFITLVQNNELIATTSQVSTSCIGTCDGSASVQVTGGIPPYTYAWSDGSTGANILNQCAGNYQITVTDAAGCSVQTSVTIQEPAAMTLDLSSTHVSCLGGCNGGASVLVSGGQAPYTYAWSSGQTSTVIGSLCAGTYGTTVTDANGCTAAGSVVVNDGVALDATITPGDATCGICDGSIAVTNISGGNGAPYTSTLMPTGTSGASFADLCAGAYTIRLEDNAGCNVDRIVNINNANGPELATSENDANCPGGCEGSAGVVVTNGTPNYTYQWDDPALQTTDAAANLCTGSYSIVVQDGLGCISVDSVTIEGPDAILANETVQNPSCFGACDGSISLNPTGGANTTYTYLWGTGETSSSRSNLCAGTYTVTVFDALGCAQVYAFQLTASANLQLSLLTTGVTCADNCNGMIASTVTGGTAPFAYQWNDPLTQNTATAVGLCPNTYELTVRDINGCTGTASATITEVDTLEIQKTVGAVNCSGTCDGSIYVEASGGSAPYSLQWNTGDTHDSLTQLCSGTYTLILTDAVGCMAFDTTVVTEGNSLPVDVDIQQAECNVCNGAITLTPSGIGPYAYTWDNGETTASVSGLCAGPIQVTVLDQGSGCETVLDLFMDNSDGPDFSLGTTDETCANTCDGTATVVINDGNGPFTYRWNDASVQSTSTATDLCPGAYQVIVTDINSCVTVDTAEIFSTDLSSAVTNTSPISCFGICDGNITVEVSGGVAPYTYTWNDPAGQTTSTALDLCAGSYEVTVTDATGCSLTNSATIEDKDSLTVDIETLSEIQCNGACNGSLGTLIDGGTTPYTVAWNTGGNNQLLNNLCPGQYDVTITDASGCLARDTAILDEPSGIADSATLTFPDCGVCNGEIVIEPSGGNGPYTIQWSPGGETTTNISGLCAGIYEVTLTDQDGCDATFSYALSNTTKPDVNLSSTPPSCAGDCDGSITANATGDAPFTYLWDDALAQTTPTATDLCIGTYTVVVTDINGCVEIIADSIRDPEPVTFTPTVYEETCAGACDGRIALDLSGGTAPYSLTWENGATSDSISSLCPDMYTVSIQDNNGCSFEDSVEVTGNAPLLIDDATVLNAACVGICNGEITLTVSGGTGNYTYAWSNNQTGAIASGLCAGDYTVQIQDENGCSLTQDYAVIPQDTITIAASPDSTICFGTSVTLSAVGSENTSVTWYSFPDLEVLSNNNNILVEGIEETSYLVEVSNGICSLSDTIDISIHDLPEIDAGEEQTILEERNTTLEATGAGIGGSYLWTPSAGLDDSTSATPLAGPLETTVYYATGTDANGCSFTDSVTIIVIPEIIINSGFSPNGDGKNDTWEILLIDEYPNAEIEIYNRWGEMLFQAVGYEEKFDGTYQGKDLPVGTYYYVIKLNDPEFPTPFTGPLTILR